MAYISAFNSPDNTTYDLKSYKTEAIAKGAVASTSTSTVYTATVDGITSLHDGVCVYLQNSIATSASGATLNVNSLGAKPIYLADKASTAITTQFKQDTAALFVYNTDRVSGGCWDLYADNTTYSISMSNNVITLTGSDGSTSTVTLPVYNGGVST